ncbi:MAG: ABC transporter permease [Pseudomonadales bacterium]|nr:ABC transporter permease [Pseudomonadales bacterium]
MRNLSTLIKVAYASLRYRIGGVGLTIASVTLSVFVLLSVEHIRQEARNGFASTVSGVDLIVGARTGEINLLLLSIFRIGNATANLSWGAVEEISEQKSVAWVVPISLGDSHRTFRVVGTTAEFFSRYKYAQKKPLSFSQGGEFDAVQDVVLGARAAVKLSYVLGDSLVLSHGVADTSFLHHEDLPFSVSGILEQTGTPVDNAIFVSLDAIEAMHSEDSESDNRQRVHEGHESHAAHEESEVHEEHEEHEEHEAHEAHKSDSDHLSHEGEESHTEEHHAAHEGRGAHVAYDAHEGDSDHPNHEGEESLNDHDHRTIGSVTAILVGLDSPISTLVVQRWINEYSEEALLGILPGVALTQLWSLLGNIEAVLLGISILVFVSSLLGLNAMLLASMRERRREIEILRSIGAPSLFIWGLLIIESLLIITIGVVLAIFGLLLAISLANDVLANELGILLSVQILNTSNLSAIGLIYLTALVMTLVPAWRAYSVSRSAGSSGSKD